VVILVGRAQKSLPAQTVSPSAISAPLAQHTGHYVSVNELAFAGYATPEAALETCKWALMKGTLEQANDTLAPDMRPKCLSEKEKRTKRLI